MITEADTCRKYVLPRLYAAGWNDDQISEQKSFTDGRIVVAGAKARRRPAKQLRVVRFSEYAAEKVRTLYPSANFRLEIADDLRWVSHFHMKCGIPAKRALAVCNL